MKWSGMRTWNANYVLGRVAQSVQATNWMTGVWFLEKDYSQSCRDQIWGPPRLLSGTQPGGKRLGARSRKHLDVKLPVVFVSMRSVLCAWLLVKSCSSAWQIAKSECQLLVLSVRRPSIRLSVRVYHSDFHWTDFHEIWFRKVLWKSVAKLKMFLNLGGGNTLGTLHEDTFIFIAVAVQIKLPQKRCLPTEMLSVCQGSWGGVNISRTESQYYVTHTLPTLLL
jgi:hypothetical protein